MKLLLYLYDNLLLVLYLVASILALCRFLSERRRACACLSALYLCLSINQLVASMVEFLPGFSRIYQTVYPSMPVFNTVISMFASICILKLDSLLNQRLKLSLHEYLLLGLLGASLLVVPILKSSRGTLFVYNTLFPLYLLYRGVSFHTPSRTLSPLFANISRAFIVFSLAAALENFLRLYLFSAYDIPPFFRIFSMDVLFGLTALFYIYLYLKKMAALHSCKAADDFKDLDFQSAAYYSFCQTYCLTLREQTILGELLNQTTDEQISAKLLISAFTVRSHIHNLLKKTGVKSRSELYALYENSTKQKSG